MAIKVANIIEEGRLGGPQIRISTVAEQLRTMGVATTVIFPFDDSKEFQKKLKNLQVRYLMMPLHRPTKEMRQLWRYLVFLPYEIFKLYRCFRWEKFDIIHASGGCLHLKGIIAARLAGTKVIWHLNDTQTPRIAKFIFKLFANKFVDGFIVAGQRVRNYYLDGLNMGTKKPVFEIQAPVDCCYFNPKGIQYDGKLALCKGINIVSIGNVNPFKGVEFFLAMARELNKDLTDLNFWMVGPIFQSQTIYFKILNKIKQDYNLKNFHFYGACHNVRQVLKSADIYICSSVAEASPISVWEAMSMKKAIVSTDVGDVSRYIKDGHNGYIVPVGDTLLMAKRVSELIQDEEKRVVFGRLSRLVAIKHHDIIRCAQAHKKVYYTLLGRLGY
jgi:glycosyltransferase involved in cell wall biosynthesis